MADTINIVDRLEIYRVYANGAIEKDYDEVAVESIVNMVIDGYESITLETSPILLEELALGYAISHQYDVSKATVMFNGFNIIKIRGCVKRESVKKERRKISIDIPLIFKVFRDALNRAILFRKTGCFHFAYASDLFGLPIDFVEDISRHCALYKLIGKLYKAKIDFGKIIIVMSSRAAATLIETMINVGIPIAIFRGAPTSLAVNKAREGGLILIAFGRTDKMNIYTQIE
uniref:Formate dehydrogenase accessory sulfurtransferase FdhD n=1 Tax=Ignisphaera aggregans TaxID=334771 RepID=A0A7C5XG12_9CREN